MNRWNESIDELECGDIDLGIKSTHYALTRILSSIRLAGWVKKHGKVNMGFLNPYIGNVCRLARERENVTMREVMLRTGYSRHTITNFESGKSGTFDLLVYYMQFLTISDVKKLSSAIVWGDEADG